MYHFFYRNWFNREVSEQRLLDFRTDKPGLESDLEHGNRNGGYSVLCIVIVAVKAYWLIVILKHSVQAVFKSQQGLHATSSPASRKLGLLISGIQGIIKKYL